MCGRYGLTAYPDALVKRLGSRGRSAKNFKPRYNIAPTQPLPAVINDDERSLVELRWGLVPFWVASPAAVKLSTFNARIETIATAPMYRDALKRTRCAILANGYYEWQKHADGTKTPTWIERRDGEAFAFAGLWSTWGRGETRMQSCTIVTQPPNAFASAIHSRMPVVLRDEAIDGWLARGDGEPATLLALLDPQPSEVWTAHAVSPRVGNVRNDDAELIARIGEGA